MSLPSFPSPEKIPTTTQAINAIISSIAMEEVALSHLIEAESEKIKLVVECTKNQGCENMQPDHLLAVNNSAAELLKSIVELQLILKEKLDVAVKHLPPPTPPVPPKPPKPPVPPITPCIPRFVTQQNYIWHKNQSLFLMGENFCDTSSEPCNDGIRLSRRKCDSLIFLPRGGKYEIMFELEAINKNTSPVKIEMEFRQGNEVVRTEQFQQDGKKMSISKLIKHETPISGKIDGKDTTLTFWLVSPESLSCTSGMVTIYSDQN